MFKMVGNRRLMYVQVRRKSKGTGEITLYFNKEGLLNKLSKADTSGPFPTASEEEDAIQQAAPFPGLCPLQEEGRVRWQ